MSDARLQQAQAWLGTQGFTHVDISILAGDASFRRYFRVNTADQSYVLMDAPPDKEDIAPFIRVCLWLQQAGLHVPNIIAQNKTQGFLLLQDFGDTTWALYIQQHGIQSPLFDDAMRQLYLLQCASNSMALPAFDMQRMRTEVDLYLDWYLPHIQQYTPDTHERQAFHHALTPILEHINALPQAPVHLDFHSRNLMLPDGSTPLGIIDFQDAVIGPITYDLASLLYDCYQDYPESERHAWSVQFYKGLPKAHQAAFANADAWHTSLRITSLQRHIKVLGIFARLAYRDGKSRFLDELPLTRKHCKDELQALSLRLPLLDTL